MPAKPATPDPSMFSQETIDAFARLAEMTKPKCGACRLPHSCCSPEQCDLTRISALEDFGAILEDAPNAGKLPFLGESGCVVAPHLRPLCAVHVCGMHLGDHDWAERYWDLRHQAEDLVTRDFSLFPDEENEAVE